MYFGVLIIEHRYMSSIEDGVSRSFAEGLR